LQFLAIYIALFFPIVVWIPLPLTVKVLVCDLNIICGKAIKSKLKTIARSNPSNTCVNFEVAKATNRKYYEYKKIA